MKKVIIILVILALAGGGACYYFTHKAKPAKAAEESTIVKVERGTIRQTVSPTGRVVSNLDVDIKCKASGEVIKLPFDVSDSVKAGELLLELDPIDQQRVLTKAEVTLSASKARLKIAEENLNVSQRTLVTDDLKAKSDLQSAEVHAKDEKAKANRVKQLLEKSLSSQEEYESAETAAIQAQGALRTAQVKLEELKTQEAALELKRQEVELAKTQVESDQIAVDIAKDRLADTKVTAPMDGIVTVRDIQIGQIISSGISNVGGGTTVLTLSDLSHIFVLASVDEADIGKVRLGHTAKITSDAHQGKTFEGKVVRIATKGVNLSNVVTFEVKLEIIGEQRNLLKPEMTTNVVIDTEQRDNILCIPESAIIRKDSKYTVEVQGADGLTEEREVKIGISDLMHREIISGLKEGESVVVYGSESSSWNVRQSERMRARMMMGGGRR